MSTHPLIQHWVLSPGIIAATVIATLTVVAYFLKAGVFSILKKRFDQDKNWCEFSVLSGLSLPLTLLIFFVGISWIIQLNDKLFHVEENVIQSARQLVVVLMGAWSIMRFASTAGDRYILAYPDADKSLVFSVAQISRLVISILAITVILEIYQIPINGVLAFGGVGAAAIAFASKDLLGNFFGGLMIYLDQPFKVGDWIRSPEKSIEGWVEYVGWRLTRIRTFDKRPLYVPNGMFSNIIVENPSRMLKRRFSVSIGIRYDDAPKLKTIVADIRAMTEAHEGVDKKENYYVYFHEFGPSSLNILVKAHTTTTVYKRFLEIQEDIFFKILEIIDKHGAECAFPTTTIHVPNQIETKVVD